MIHFLLKTINNDLLAYFSNFRKKKLTNMFYYKNNGKLYLLEPLMLTALFKSKKQKLT